MAKRNFKTRGSFIPKDKKGKHNRIVVDSPALAEFLTTLEAGSSVLSEDIVAGEAVGGVAIGDVFEAGTTLEDVIRTILEGAPSAGIQGFQLLDENLNLLGDVARIAGDEYTIGGIRILLNDPGDLVDVIVYAPGTEATEDLTPPTQGETQNIDVVTDYTAGGNASDFAYTFAQGGAGSFAKLNATFSLTMKDAEGNQVGSVSNTGLTWTPPAFMLNIVDSNGLITSWEQMSSIIAGGQTSWDGLSGILEGYLATLFNDIYAPIVRHTKSGSYTSSDIDSDGNPVAWGYDPSITTFQVGGGEQGVPINFYPETEYRQVWFIPAGGQVTPIGAVFTSITVGGGTYTPTATANTININIGQGGLGLSTSTTPCPVTYRLYASPQTNSVYPNTADITFNS